MSRDYVLQQFRPPVKLQIDYAHELNEQQCAAVTAAPGPALVIAGAGSGKTRTLTYRVAYLLEHGIAPEKILLLTFTNKAAKEMMRRVVDLLGQEMNSLWGGTFHSIGNRILRQHAHLIGYQRDFTIMDRDDAKQLVSTCLGESEIDVKATRFPKPDVLVEIFSLAVNTRKSIGEIMGEQYGHFAHLATSVSELQKKYVERKRTANAMDFDDLLVLWLRLLNEHAAVREHYQRRFQFILVDEYQDTNKLQAELIDTLAALHKNVMVVGDDAQSIYAWRGANFQNILRFPERYADAKIYKIEVNYRSTPEILQVANAAIAANSRQFSKALVPASKPGMKPVVVACEDGSQQAAFVAQRVLELRDEGIELKDIAVLYRSHFHALELQLELVRRNIPFTITSGIRFFEQAHVKDVTAYLKLVMNPRDELSFKRLVELMPGIGSKAAAKLWGKFEGYLKELRASQNPQSGRALSPKTPDSGRLGEAAPPGTGAGTSGEVQQGQEEPLADAAPVENPFPVGPVLAPLLQRCAESVPTKAKVAWAQFVATIAQLEADSIRGNPAEMIRLVIEAGYDVYLQETYTNHRARLDDLEQLSIFARQFSTLEDFLSQLALLTNLESEDEQPADKDDEQLRLSTIHQAKGLEFDAVFVIMLCDGMFPSARSLESEEGEEEERRLMYVAITRARKELYLSYPNIRARFGSDGDMYQRRSRFLNEIPPELLDDWNLKPF